MPLHSNPQNDILSIGSIGQSFALPAEIGVARRGQFPQAEHVPLTTPHISPLDINTPIKIENSSVRTGIKTVRFIWDETNETESGGYYLTENPADVSPVYVPRFDGKAEIWAGASLISVRRAPERRLGNLHLKALTDSQVEDLRKEQMQAVSEGREARALRLGGGLRGKVVGFSKGSRRRMMKTLGKIRNDLVPVFVTLTYPAEFPHDSVTWKKHLDIFFKRLRRRFPESSALWKLEPQQRGAPHYHILMWGAEYPYLLAWCARAWFEIVDSGDEKHFSHGTRVEQIRSWRGVMSYASKYLGKLQVSEESSGDWQYPGRWWGVYGSSRMPWGECIVADLSRLQSIRLIRTMRKCMKLKRRDFCSLSMLTQDASVWFRRLDALIC